MTQAPRPSPRLRGLTVGLVVGLITVAGTAAVAFYYVDVYYTKLSKIPSCSGGLGGGSCVSVPPPRVGLSVLQLGKGQNSNGTYTYLFLFVPEPPPSLNASSVLFRFYNFTFEGTLTPSNATLSYPNGTPLATYHPVGLNWTTTSQASLYETSVLTVQSTASLSGGWLQYRTSGSDQRVAVMIA